MTSRESADERLQRHQATPANAERSSDKSSSERERLRLDPRTADDNRSTANNWTYYASHRRHVFQLLQSIGTALSSIRCERRLVVLGAGNCNDLELPMLLGLFEQVALVDIDRAAMEAAVGRQQVKNDRIELLGVDIAEDHPRVFGRQRATVVLSATVLSQLIRDSIMPSNAQVTAASTTDVTQLRRRHLELMDRLAGDDGACLLINDMASSLTVPHLPYVPPTELSKLVVSLIEERNFFTGCNPFAICEQVADAAKEANPHVALSAPWIWQMGRDEWRVCYAVRWR